MADRLNTLPGQLSRVRIRPTGRTLNNAVLNQFFFFFFFYVRRTIHRPVCFTSKSQDGNILAKICTWEPHSTALAIDALTISWDMMFGYAFPTNMPGSESIGTHETVSVPAHPNCSTIPETLLIHNITTNECCTTNTSSLLSLVLAVHIYTLVHLLCE